MTGIDVNGEYRPVFVGADGHFGSSTAKHQDGAGTITGNFSYIYPHTSTVLSSVTTANIEGDPLTGLQLQAGSPFRCCYATSITVSTGRITAYNA